MQETCRYRSPGGHHHVSDIYFVRQQAMLAYLVAPGSAWSSLWLVGGPVGRCDRGDANLSKLLCSHFVLRSLHGRRCCRRLSLIYFFGGLTYADILVVHAKVTSCKLASPICFVFYLHSTI